MKFNKQNTSKIALVDPTVCHVYLSNMMMFHTLLLNDQKVVGIAFGSFGHLEEWPFSCWGLDFPSWLAWDRNFDALQVMRFRWAVKIGWWCFEFEYCKIRCLHYLNLFDMYNYIYTDIYTTRWMPRPTKTESNPWSTGSNLLVLPWQWSALMVISGCAVFGPPKKRGRPLAFPLLKGYPSGNFT